MKKYIIVGGVAGGATAAARLRRLDEQAEIILVERGGEISFANCGLPYYVGGVIKERDELLLMLPQRFRNIFNVDVRTHSEVVKVDTANKKVSIRNSKGEYEESYDALVLSPGAKALRPPIPGIDNKHILTLRNVPDADALRDLSLRYPEGKENITKYTYESWHFRYVGVDASTFIHDNNITLEEYYAFFVENI